MPPGGVLYVPFALPQLNYRDDYDRQFTLRTKLIQSKWKSLPTWTRLFQPSLKLLPGEIAKALIQTVLAVASQVAIEEATKDQQQDNLGVFILATVAKVAAAEAFTQADDRSWYSLPKQIMVQKIATPKNGKIAIRAGSSSETSFEVDPNNQTNFVYLKSIRRGNPIKVLSSFGFEQGLAEFYHPKNTKIFATNH